MTAAKLAAAESRIAEMELQAKIRKEEDERAEREAIRQHEIRLKLMDEEEAERIKQHQLKLAQIQAQGKITLFCLHSSLQHHLLRIGCS